MKKYDSVPKINITNEDFRMMMKYLKRLLPLSGDMIIKNAVRRYYEKHKEKQDGLKNLQLKRHQLLVEQKHECYYCHKYLDSKNATLEHKNPLARGGTWDPENLSVACEPCNNKKGAMNEEEFKQFLEDEKRSKLSDDIQSLGQSQIQENGSLRTEANKEPVSSF